METQIKLERILIADDKEENRNAARLAIPDATIVGSAREAISQLDSQEYDLVLTDMQMETPLAGLDVIKKSMKKTTIAYVITHTGIGHGKQTVEVCPYLHNMTSRLEGKADPETWKEALGKIRFADGSQRNYQEAILMTKKYGSSIDLGDDVLKVIFYPFKVEGEQR